MLLVLFLVTGLFSTSWGLPQCPEVDGPDSVYFAHENCSQFWQCSNGVPYLFNCSANLHWNPTLLTCDYPESAGCACEEPKSTYAQIECPAVDGADSVYFAHENCSQFWQCSNGVPYLQNCSANLHFNPSINTCDYPDSAGCASRTKTSNCRVSSEPLTSTTLVSSSATENSLLSSIPSNKNASVPQCPEVDGPDSVYFAHENCSKFWQCSNGVPYLFNCSANLHWNPTLLTCDYPESAGCACEAAEATKQNQLVKIECPEVDGPDSVYFAHENCSQFWQCSNGVAYLQNCSATLHFNPTINTCDYPDNAGCASSAKSSNCKVSLE